MRGAAAVAVLFVAACAGTAARNASTSAAQSLSDVRKFLVRGVAVGQDAGELTSQQVSTLLQGMATVTAAIQQDQRYLLRGAPLVEMEEWAIRGVDAALLAGELGPNGADIVRDQMTQFFGLVTRLGQED